MLARLRAEARGARLRENPAMAKSKRAPALLELMKGSGREGADTPGDGFQAPDQTDAPLGDTGRDETARDREANFEPVCEVVGSRIRFSLTQRSATIIVGIAGIVLAGACLIAYRLGETRGKEKARVAVDGGLHGELEQRRSSTPTRNLFEGIGDDPTIAFAGAEGGGSAPAPVAVVDGSYEAPDEPWVPGYNYVVVQDFKSDARGDAIEARDFLAENGLRCVILEMDQASNYRYRLITVTGFNLDDTAQRVSADGCLDKVRRIGRAYSESGGRYDFQSAYFKKLTGDRW